MHAYLHDFGKTNKISSALAKKRKGKRLFFFLIKFFSYRASPKTYKLTQNTHQLLGLSLACS